MVLFKVPSSGKEVWCPRRGDFPDGGSIRKKEHSPSDLMLVLFRKNSKSQ